MGIVSGVIFPDILGHKLDSWKGGFYWQNCRSYKLVYNGLVLLLRGEVDNAGR